MCSLSSSQLACVGITTGLWAQVPSVTTTFTAVDDAGNGGMHPEVTMTPPLAPQVFTTFLLGSAQYGYTLVPQVDAPECMLDSLVEENGRSIHLCTVHCTLYIAH